MATSSVAELKDALRTTLDRNGALNDIRARLRQEIFKALNETNIIPKPDLPSETLIINELIREYLIYHGFRETLSVFLPEANQPVTRPFDRSFLAEHLNVMDGPNTKQLPLLYNLVNGAAQPQRSQDDINTVTRFKPSTTMSPNS